MTETVIKQDSGPEIDGELLEEAQRQIGAAWPNEAINEALRELVEDRRARRRQAGEDLRRMSDEGLFDYGALDEADR
jgi:Arc/MetJ family transcription regulator